MFIFIIKMHSLPQIVLDLLLLILQLEGSGCSLQKKK